MFETTFSADNQNAHFADYVVKKVAPEMEKIDGIVTTLGGKNRVYVSMACADAFRFPAKRLAESVAVDVIACGYKNAFLHQKLGVDYEDFFADVLIDTMCVFDNDYDKTYVKKALDDGDKIYFDGYCNFRIGALKQRWSELAEMILKNDVLLSDCDVIAEFLTYLMESVSTAQSTVSVTFDNGFTLFSAKNKVIEPVCLIEKFSTSEKQAMVNLVCLRPDKVRVYGKTSPEFDRLAGSLFQVEKVAVN